MTDANRSSDQCTEAVWLRILAFILRTTDAELTAIRKVKSWPSHDYG